MSKRSDLLKQLPKVDDLMNHPRILEETSGIARPLVLEVVREAIEDMRQLVLGLDPESTLVVDPNQIATTVLKKVHQSHQMNLKKVINATGVVLHTNLGRAPLSQAIKEQVWSIAEHYSTLEYNLETGKRGSRYAHVDEIIKKITGAESALVVNNNAAAVLLILSTLAKGTQVIVSRGELVEIGGSFRVPEIMAQSGCDLVEVGATNKTHVRDYENNIRQGLTGALLKVYTSNFKIMGFTQEVSLEEMVAIGKKHDIPVIHDLGCGALVDFAAHGIPGEANVFDSVKAGADIVCFSGDKLLGGPQAGIIIGKKVWIDQMKKNPLTRAFRIDKLTLAALEATLRLYYDPAKALSQIPILKMLTMPLDVIKSRSEVLKSMLDLKLKDVTTHFEEGVSQVGGGAMPMTELPTRLIGVKPQRVSVTEAEERLRRLAVPVIVRIQKDCIYLDVRTIMNEDFEVLTQALSTCLNE